MLELHVSGCSPYNVQVDIQLKAIISNNCPDIVLNNEHSVTTDSDESRLWFFMVASISSAVNRDEVILLKRVVHISFTFVS